jgi:hypothetical protein
MRHLWRFLTLLGGLVLTLIAFSMIAATTLPGGASALFQDSALSVRFRYPASWQTERDAATVLAQPGAEEALFVVARGATPALPEPLSSALRESENRRAADNVAVGGVSGRETIVEVDSTAGGGDAPLANALIEAEGELMTLIVWEALVDGEPVQVIMADARSGAYLSLLQEMRASLEWE